MIQTENAGTAVALGFFDGVHKGHCAVLSATTEQAKNKGLIPSAFTFTTHHSRPNAKTGGLLLSEEDKARIMEDLGIRREFCPDFESFRNLSGEEFVRDMLCAEFGARVVCCGGDFRFGKGACWGTAELKTLCACYGAELVTVPEVLEEGERISSTRIRQALAQGNIPLVNRMLGRRYGFRFEVVHGNRLGSEMSTPTINQRFPQDFALPRFGVYASFAQVDGVWHSAVTNIGVKPTVTNDGIPLAETFLHGTHCNLYGRQVPLQLLQFLRPEAKFASTQELRAAILHDAQVAQKICENTPQNL